MRKRLRLAVSIGWMVSLLTAAVPLMADDDIPFAADSAETAPAEAPAPDPEVQPFMGALYVRTDTGDSLPVYINGRRVGMTPFRSGPIPVGQYEVSFMRPALRDSLLNFRSASAMEIPLDYRRIFKPGITGTDILLKSLAEVSTQTVVAKNNVETEVLFSVKEASDQANAASRSIYSRILFGGGLIVVVAMILLFTI